MSEKRDPTRPLFGKGADTLARVAIALLIIGPILLWGVVHAFSGSPWATGQGRVVDQPVPFSHEHHVGELGIDCRFCHATVEASRYAGAPSLYVCMTCHSQLFTNADILAPIRTHAANAQFFEWKRVHRLPDYVYFDHHVHIANGVPCSACHGDVATMPLTAQAEPLTMQWCLGCHRDPRSRLSSMAAITNTDPRAHEDSAAINYMRAYAIHPQTLTECSTCHR